jgi:hypothetical protein
MEEAGWVSGDSSQDHRLPDSSRLMAVWGMGGTRMGVCWCLLILAEDRTSSHCHRSSATPDESNVTRCLNARPNDPRPFAFTKTHIAAFGFIGSTVSDPSLLTGFLRTAVMLLIFPIYVSQADFLAPGRAMHVSMHVKLRTGLASDFNAYGVRE